MVAESAPLPNVRRLFIPDPGYVIAEADLAGADAQVVAWEAEDEPLKEAFRQGLKVHAHNAEAMFGKYVESGPVYQACKVAVHLTNYGGGPRTLAISQGWTVHEADTFQKRWFSLHPAIKRWHERIEQQLAKTRTVSNKFGYHRVYFDRIRGLLPEALAWIPQSTVALVCAKGALQLEEHMPDIQLLLQVHDSIVFQYPTSWEQMTPSRLEGVHQSIRTYLSIPIPYNNNNFLVIPWKLKTSRRSWGECE